MIRKLLCPVIAIALGGFLQNSLHAHGRAFTYSYEATTAEKGEFELENWMTWKVTRSHGDDRGGHEFDFRHELELGVTDRLELSLYLVNWNLRDDAEHRRSARYESSSIEAKYNLTNPNTDFLGSALLAEAGAGNEGAAFEGKIILQKNIGPWIVAYNVGVEHQMTGEHFGSFHERTGEFEQSLGISYEVIPQFRVGAEVVHGIDFPDWKKAEDSVVYAGPNASFRHKNWFATITPLIQLTDVREEPDVQTRIIVGVEF